MRIVLIGGGHSHAIALWFFGKYPPVQGVELILISDCIQTPYSGMLPGHIAGFYTYQECHINLIHLARFARAKLCLDRVIGLDLHRNQVICAHNHPISFDVVCLDIGSTPAILTVPGALEYATPVKPIPQFLRSWSEFLTNISQRPQQPVNVGIVGGGAGGVELALTMQARLGKIIDSPANLHMHLFQRGMKIMPSHHPTVRCVLQSTLKKRGINIHLGASVVKLDSPVPPKVQIITKSGFSTECDRIFWVTHASAPTWLRDAGLATDAQGFVLVDETLQSISHSQVFATGDIASILNHPRPKAGVFAVRQGKPLYTNLCRLTEGKPLKNYIPQRQYLSLIGTGDKRAIASRGCFTLPPHPLIWWWKDRIDHRFMQRFSF
ncbi:FAD-dependent oxidoreductase [Calothrix sp. NIES-3974]|uniref:FAD-dependent oxidoreductase n=1 Tax=Calothrix sp. NIES-3974 TaxID=2005462 RepID=UPI000B61A5E0|nr:FAD-dependent oxidoreductase [Calothrix sp. NIES-3974]BAZ04980.1 FAD-dependent pyridine nucleotide-disulfide oxidoreductase [Calothrix sp. NIES-3974]